MIDGVKAIKLSSKKPAWVIIDEEDYHLFKEKNLHLHQTGRALVYKNNKLEYVARIILGVDGQKEKWVKYMNGDKLDCRKANLYILDRSPDRRSKLWRDINLRRKYGFSEQDFDELLKQQKGKCAICGFTPLESAKLKYGQGKIPSRYKKLCVDHCHESKQVRGLLCWWCNVGLGSFRDNKDSLQNAINYLKKE